MTIKVHGFAVTPKESKFLGGRDVVSLFRIIYMKNPHNRSYGRRQTPEGLLSGNNMTKLKQGDILWIREPVRCSVKPHHCEHVYISDGARMSTKHPDLEDRDYEANRMPSFMSRFSIRIDNLKEMFTKEISFPTPEQMRVGIHGDMAHAYTRMMSEFSLDWDERWPRTGWKFDDNPVALRITGKVIKGNIVDVLGSSAPSFLRGTDS